MRRTSRKLRWLGILAALFAVGFVVVRTWVVPAIIVRQIEAQYHGKVVVGDWWFGLNSAGISGVKLSESNAPDAPVWFTADRISTDVSIARLIRGRVMPTRIEIDRPKVDFRLDAKGQPLTKVPVDDTQGAGAKGKPAAVPLPEIIARDGVVTLAQDGRKPMILNGVEARLSPVPDGSNLSVKTDDPIWGQVAVTGHFDPTFKSGTFEIDSSPGFVADTKKLESIPFIPADVWSNLEPRGPVDAKVKITLNADSPKPVTVHTELTLKGTTARLNTLQVEATDATGRVIIDDALVRIEDLKGRTIDGTIAAKGLLDFGQKVPRFDLDVRLKDIDVTKTPAAWQLGEVGATGRISGRVDLKVKLDPSGPDLTGTDGRAVIEDGSFQGIPIKSMDLGLRADGKDLQYETLPQGSVDKNNLDAPTTTKLLAEGGPSPASGGLSVPESVLAALPLLDLASREQNFLGWAAFLAKEAIDYMADHPSGRQKGGLRLPRTITTQIELEDVDLLTLIDKGKKFGIEIPVPVAGRFSIRATATIPLGTLGDVKAYAFKGDATLRGASIDHVDLGLVTTHVELARGVLDLSDFRGQFVDRPSGNANDPPRPTPDVPTRGPLPTGAFRGHLRASISPRGSATAHLEGERLPLGEVFAPFLPNPSPISGELTLLSDAKVDLGTIADPKTWSLNGHLDSRRIKYQSAILDQVATRFEVQQGHAIISDFAARLLGKPLTARANLELAAPHRFDGGVTVEGWEIGEVLKFVPGLPNIPAIAGVLDAKGEASGALQPLDISTRGAARVLRASVGPSPIGNVGFQWKTDAEVIAITGLELFAFGGKTTGEARIPIRPGQPLRASAELNGIDVAKLSAAIPDQSVILTGKADGRIDLTMPLDASVIEGRVKLVAPDLTVREGKGQAQGIAVRSLLVQAVARNGLVDYEATAEGLGGKFRFHGSAPVAADLSKVVSDGEALGVGFRVGEVWKGLGMSGSLAQLDGVGAFDANIRARIQPFQPAGRGRFELRDLRYGKVSGLGGLKGVATLTPPTWRVEQLEGELLGGMVSGDAHSESFSGGSKVVGFDLKMDRVNLSKIARMVPSLAKEVEGFGSARVAGRLADAVQASAEILVPRARAFGIPIIDLRFPAEVEMVPATGSGSINSRHWTARVAGGSVRGSALNRFGHDQSFQAEVNLTGVDLEVLSKFHPTGKRPPTGKVSGKLTLHGPNPEHLDKVRGRVDLDLDDASLVELPLFKEMDRFLGASGGGGLFEDGDVHGTIANKTLYVEQMTLTGRLIQVHATGSIAFNGGLNLEVLVNTNSKMSSSDLALLGLVPGIGQALGRGEEAVRRMANVLENSLLRFRVSGTTANPKVQLDPGIAVGGDAVGFFSTIIKPQGR